MRVHTATLVGMEYIFDLIFEFIGTGFELLYALTFNIWPVWLVVGIVWFFRRKRRDNHPLPNTSAHGGGAQEIADIAHTQTEITTSDARVPLPQVASSPVPNALEEAVDSFIHWCKEDTLLKLGGLFVLIAAGMFLVLSITENWISRDMRIVLGVLVGLSGYVLGWFRVQRNVAQGAIVSFVGAATIVATLLVAQRYDMFPPLLVTGALFVVAVSLATLAATYKRKVLGTAAVLLGAAAPLMIGLAGPNGDTAMVLTAPEVYTYLLALSVGTLWLVYITGWRFILVVLILTQVYYSAQFSWGDQERDSLALLLSIIFSALYFFVHAVAVIRDQTYRIGDISTALLLGGTQLIWVIQEGSVHWQTTFLAGWALVFVVGSWLTYRATSVLHHFLAYGALAATYLATATALEFDGPVLYMLFSIEATLLVIGVHLVTRRLGITKILTLPLLVPLFLSLSSITSFSWATGWLHDDFFVLFTNFVCFGLLGWYFSITARECTDDTRYSYHGIASLGYAIAFCYTLILCWLVPHGMFPSSIYDFGDVLSMIIYSVLGVGIYLYERMHHNDTLRFTAFGLIGFVVLHLVFIDLNHMQQLGRIITFFIIGCLFMSTVWLERSRSATSEHE